MQISSQMQTLQNVSICDTHSLFHFLQIQEYGSAKDHVVKFYCRCGIRALA